MRLSGTLFIYIRIKEFKSPSGNSFIFILLLSPLSFYYYSLSLSFPLYFNVAETVLFVLRMNRIQRASTARCFPPPPPQLFESKHFAFSFGTESLFKNLAKVIGSIEGPPPVERIVHNVSETYFSKKCRLDRKRRFQFSASIIELNPSFYQEEIHFILQK